ncbi:type VI secretion system protein TssA [Noviherbaspirillum saxi]|uniref:Type VI secretion system protein TssA n=2 Tax=Noviherbaspirillum saxi TaxID=2320863 RepID=A0A3A3FJH6_9BURK|nr:type VI secretion system protein TssA [Noviherbaspirillum saxi]
MATRKKMFAASLSDLYDKARSLVSSPTSVPAPAPVHMEILPMSPPGEEKPRILMNPDHQAELEVLLAPITENEPCGPAMRYDPAFTEIRLAREEDDPSLPMGQWERPLKRADWVFIEDRCKGMLANRSKDLQLAVWLLESWTRQHGFEGLLRGLHLVDELLRQHWTAVHPVIDEDNDCDARIAPLVWLNESMSMTLKVHVPLLNVAGRKPPKVSFADWERLTARELSGQDHATDKTSGVDSSDLPLIREDVISYAHQHLYYELQTRIDLVRRCLICLSSLTSFVDTQLGMDSPNLARLHGTLTSIERVFTQLIPVKNEPAVMEELPVPHGVNMSSATAGEMIMAPPVTLSHWQSRHEAYVTLEAIADYLAVVEPHSPTPYLLRRAVNWGRMPLPELMAEIIREEGDLNRLMNVLGLRE